MSWGRDEVYHAGVTTIESYINECGETTKSKGFDTSNIPAQTLLQATEVAEALENFTNIGDDCLRHWVAGLIYFCERVEQNRKFFHWSNEFTWKDSDSFANWIEEQADVVIRVFSVVGANGWTPQFLAALRLKMDKNRDRPHMHGKKN